MKEYSRSTGLIAFALVYLTFFLDNVLLTVLVPIIPDWVRGESLELWSQHGAPLAALLNSTVRRDDGAGAGTRQAEVGAVLGAKAAAQLALAPAAAALAAARGPAAALRLATALLAAAALAETKPWEKSNDLADYNVPDNNMLDLETKKPSRIISVHLPFSNVVENILFGWCAGGGLGGGALCAGAGRAAQGGGAALGGVAGLALAARALPAPRRARALGALLGAVALGVLVGYPFGGTAYKLWSLAAPFQLIAVALLINLGEYVALLQDTFETENPDGTATRKRERIEGAGGVVSGARVMWAEARRGATGACAGAVLLTTCVMAALEPCLPLWIMEKFQPERWALGCVFLPDSAGYLLAASSLGAPARRLGPERVAVTAVAAVGLAALAVPHAPSEASNNVEQFGHSEEGIIKKKIRPVRLFLCLYATTWPHGEARRQVGWLAAPQALLGAGLGAADAALLPAVLARRPRALPHRAALLQAASSAAYAIGPVAGGLVSWGAGFETALRALGVANLLYAAVLYRALSADPLSEQWGASATPEDSDEEGEEMTPLEPANYALR
ncbi:synaptic vesicular amine transporter-like [Melitaea cinxia]|uniref:synaptic vesicular amine transporter-like n=1 Tax=Melitaea cinxia TaxID=113334 RepID=UPI001E274508|nr:synaptic vesicular amine transporter-like [Melitaea cinxia]